ncbi:hypothetical protein CR513_42652, partial [Mucuna pruriens]
LRHYVLGFSNSELYKIVLEEKIENLGDGLESRRLDTQSFNAKVNSLSKGKEKKDVSRRESEASHDESYKSHLSRSSRSHGSERVRRHEKEEYKRTPIELIKVKIPPFVGDGGPNVYYDWELKVKQHLKSFDCEDMIKVKLLTLSFEGYVLICWSEIVINIRG